MSDLLLENAATTGAGRPVWVGGRGWLEVWGTFDGASATLQFMLPDAASYGDACQSLSSAGGRAFELPPCTVRVSVTSPGVGTSLSARVVRIP